MGQTLSTVLPSWGVVGGSRDSDSDGHAHSCHAYRYPPKAGHSYFASHFIMGGEKFDSPQPESFLFGDNCDLNYLGCKPVSFPYPPPQANEPTKTIKSQMNVRKDSVHFTLVKDESASQENEGDDAPPVAPKRYRPQFTFDSDVRCAIVIHFFCTEEIHPQGITYHSKRRDLTTKTFEYGRGANQVFLHQDIIFAPADCTTELNAAAAAEDSDIISAAIHMISLEGDAPRQTHVTLCSIDRYTDDAFSFKAVKQKIFVDGLTYLLQEIYGLENKAAPPSGGDASAAGRNYADLDDVDDDCGAECVVCMCDLRDTIILPCRHLCLCNACADSLRYQASNCPICRAPFRALLQLRAVQKVGQVTHPALADPETSQEGVPPGYQCVSLMEALNGPLTVPQPPPPIPAVVSTRTHKSRSGKSSSRSGGSSSSRHHRSTGSSSANSHSVPPAGARPSLAEGEEDEEELMEEAEMGKDPPSAGTRRRKGSQISVKYVNEVDPSAPLSSDPATAADSLKPTAVTANSVGASRATIDLVDEELANLNPSPRTKEDEDAAISEEDTEACSDDPLASDSPRRGKGRQKRKQTAKTVVRDLEEDGDDVEEDEEDGNPDAEPEEDEAMVVNLTSTGRSTRISLPGTPTSLASLRSASASVSHQDSASSSCASSAASTKQLLPVGGGSGQRQAASAVIVRVHPSTDEGDDEEEC